MSTPSGTISLSLFGTEAQPPSPTEGASAVESHEPFIPHPGLVLGCDFQDDRPGEIREKVRPAYRHHFYSSVLWAQILGRMHGAARRPNGRPPSTLDPRLVLIGKQIEVHREHFETDWAFARYLRLRLAHFLEHDLSGQVELLFRKMVEAAPETHAADSDRVGA